MAGVPSNIVLADLTVPPIKGNVSPIVATALSLRDGSRPTNNPPPPPEFTLSATSNSITATITEGNGADSYEIRLEGGDTVSGRTLTSLTPETLYLVQLRGVNQYGSGDWSDPVEWMTGVQSSGTPDFEDDFSSGNLSKVTNGYRWGTPGGNVSVANGRVELDFGPDANGADSTAELNFDFGEDLSEVWVQYDLYVPANYTHRSQSGVTNNKFFQFNYNGSAYQALTIESVEGGGGYSDLKRFLSASQRPNGSNNWPTDESPGTPNATVQDFIGNTGAYAIRTGQWNQIRVHFRSSTDGTIKDGVAEIWANGVLLRSLPWEYWNIATQGKINGGYVMGFSNSGYTQATKFLVDNFKVYATNPGWS